MKIVNKITAYNLPARIVLQAISKLILMDLLMRIINIIATPNLPLGIVIRKPECLPN